MAMPDTSYFPQAGSSTLAATSPGTVTVDDAATNTSTTLLTLTHTTSGTAAASFGADFKINLESGAGTTRNAAIWRTKWTTATDGAEVAAQALGIMSAGSMPAAGSEQYRWAPAQMILDYNSSETAPGIYFKGTQGGVSGIYSNPGPGTYFSSLGITIGSAQTLLFTDGGIRLADNSQQNFVCPTGTGFKLGTATSQKISLWNATPTAQYSTTGTLTGFTAATTTPVLDGSTFTGGAGTKAYTIGDIVLALKTCGIMAAS